MTARPQPRRKEGNIMTDNQIFYRCPICGNVIGMIYDSGVSPFCCGQPMEQLTADTVDGAVEKHVPVCTRKDGTLTVSVGKAPHPMISAHSILWIYLQTDRGGHRRILHPGDSPEACFRLCEGEVPLRVYAYCNVHGLWSADC